MKQGRTNHGLIFALGMAILVSSLAIIVLLLAYKNYSERSQRNRIYLEIGEDIRSRLKSEMNGKKSFKQWSMLEHGTVSLVER